VNKNILTVSQSACGGKSMTADDAAPGV